eukprot:SAG22_NODE_8233_length_672_cov_1.359511_1_plen_100_part_01
MSDLDGSTQHYCVIWPHGVQLALAGQVEPPPAATDLLLALHGHGSDRKQFATSNRGECAGARAVAARHGMVYVSPDYRPTTSWMGPAAEADDVQLLRIIR